MAQRQSKGRQRIPIQRIENQDSRYAAFSKRRLGIYKKASELCTLCGVDIGIITFSPTGTPPYSYFSPTMESVIDRFKNPNMQPDDFALITDSHTIGRTSELNYRLNESLVENEAKIEQAETLEEKNKTRQKEWWEETPVEQMNTEQVRELKTRFEDYLSKSSIWMDQLKIGASSSSTFRPKNVLEHGALPYVPSTDERMTLGSHIPNPMYVPPVPYNPSRGRIEEAGSSKQKDMNSK